jgi:hypothetical protein
MDKKTKINVIDAYLRKLAQSDPRINALAKKLMSNLVNEFAGLNSQITAEPNTSLNLSNLSNLNSLLTFLDEKKVKINGERIAYATLKSLTNSTDPRNGEPLEEISDGERAKLDPISVRTSRDAITKNWNEADFLVNIPSLTAYVQYLYKKAIEDKSSSDNTTKANGEMLEILTGKIINSINVIRPNSGLAPVEKSEPGKPKELDAQTNLDFFGNKVFDPKNYYADNGTGPIKLSVEDLKSKESLNAWLSKSPEAQIIFYDESGKPFTLKWTDPNCDQCVLLNLLYLRGQQKLSKTTNEDEIKSANYYLRRLKDLSSSFFGKDGKSCSVTGTFSPTKKLQDQSIKKETPQETQKKSVDFGKAAQMFPLRIEDISFLRISAFLNAYSTIVSDDKRDELSGISQIVTQAQQDIRTRLKNSDKKTFSLSADAKEVAFLWLKAPPGNHYTRFLESLLQVVEGAEEAINLFKTQFADDPAMQKMHQTELDWLFAQVGKSPTDNSIAYRNKAEIKGWLNQVSVVNLFGKSQ